MSTGTSKYDIYGQIENIPGWLNTVTAHRTFDILEWQTTSGIAGNLMEIGVFCGRYFSILITSAISAGEKAFGFDTFQYAPMERALAEIAGVFGESANESFHLVEGSSSRLTPAELEGLLGRPRFISVDGAHDFENVYRDMVLADQLISADGIVAADDFLNPMTLGVNQAINQFLSEPRAIVPVAYISNKLFLAHRSRAEDYRSAIERMIDVADDPQSEHFRKQRDLARHNIEQDFYGHRVLLT